MRHSLFSLALAVTLALPAFADEHDPVAAAIQAAVDSDIRTAEERERDANRKPVETLLFFGLRPDMKVLEIFPGGGWYTKILAPVLKEEGKLYVQAGTNDRITALREAHEPLSALEVVSVDAGFQPTDEPGIYRFTKDVEFPVDDLDLVLTFRNLHNLDEEARGKLYAAIYEALDDGGHLGAVDHTRRHMAPHTREVWRRLDPVQVILEAEKAGFEFVGYSDLHYRPDDELRYEVGRKTVTGNTDRFTLLFRKPE